MDQLAIRGLKAEAVIGHHPWERRLRQPLRIDLDLGIDAARPAATDTLADALDYQAVAEATVNCVETSECTLIETLAERIAGRLRETFRIAWVRVTVHKPGALRGADDVAVTVERGKR